MEIADVLKVYASFRELRIDPTGFMRVKMDISGVCLQLENTIQYNIIIYNTGLSYSSKLAIAIAPCFPM